MKTGLWALAITVMAGAGFAEDVKEGAALYMKHCATCHGIDMDGNGPMAGVLVIKPDNLLTLSQENGGAFPLVRVIKRIDGRDPLVSHGSPMPVYGDFFEGVDVTLKAPTGQPIMTSQSVVELVAFLQSVQQ